MPYLNIIEAQLNKIIVDKAISDDTTYTSLIILNDSIPNISTIDIGGLQGPPGPPGPSGLSIVGPQGEQGIQGLKGDMGPPGSGISLIKISDTDNNTTVISGTSGQLSFVGAGTVSVSVNDSVVSIFSPVLNNTFAPLDHTHNTSHIINFNESVDNRVSQLLKAENYIEITYNNPDFNTLSIEVTGLTIGVNTQQHSPILDSISSINSGANHLLYLDGLQSVGVSPITSVGRTLLSATTTSLQRTFLGLGTISTFDDTDFARIVGDNFFNGNQYLGDGTISRFSAFLEKHTTSSYTIEQSNNGKIIVLDNSSSAISVSFDDNLTPGFNCLVVQSNSGQVRFSDSVANRYSHTKLVGRYSIATLLKIDQDTIILSGDTTLANSGP